MDEQKVRSVTDSLRLLEPAALAALSGLITQNEDKATRLEAVKYVLGSMAVAGSAGHEVEVARLKKGLEWHKARLRDAGGVGRPLGPS